jgi:hypothetical protein
MRRLGSVGYGGFEWEEGSELIGDFVAALGRVVLQARVANELLRSFAGFKKGPVGMWEPANLSRRRMRGRRTRVLLPYEGPELCEMVVTRDVPLRSKSTVKIEIECKDCGRIQYKSFEGIAEKDMGATIPRKPGKGLFFAQKDLQGADFFRPRYTGFILCTDLAKKLMEERQYNNIEFLEVGEILK